MQHTHKINEPYIGQNWTSSDAKWFQVTGLMSTEDDARVNYTNVKTLQEYSCRLEAFKYRFQPVVD